jgi:hypothetical protein
MAHDETHAQKQTNRYVEVTPGHAPRKESALFARSRDELIHDHGFGCFIANGECDHASPLEAHHHFVEWSKTNAVDWAKLAEAARAHHLVNPQNGDDLYNVDWEAVKRDPASFVDSTFNLVILCSVHHRDPSNGIHHIPSSLWLLQKYARDGFNVTEAASADKTR